MSNLDEIKTRLVKLSKMTTENGCSEAEALTAASKIAAILDENGMTFDEVKAYSESNDTNKEKMEFGNFGEKKKLHEVQYCVTGIARFFDCKVIASQVMGTTGRVRAMRFFGFPEDVAACITLTHTLVSAMETEFRNYMLSNTQDIHGKTLRKAFMVGFTGRILARLKTLKVERSQQKTTGTALVVLKNQIVEKSFADLNMKLSSGTATRYQSNTSAYEAGAAAGNRANLTNHKQVTTSNNKKIA